MFGGFCASQLVTKIGRNVFPVVHAISQRNKSEKTPRIHQDLILYEAHYRCVAKNGILETLDSRSELVFWTLKPWTLITFVMAESFCHDGWVLPVLPMHRTN